MKFSTVTFLALSTVASAAPLIKERTLCMGMMKKSNGGSKSSNGKSSSAALVSTSAEATALYYADACIPQDYGFEAACMAAGGYTLSLLANPDGEGPVEDYADMYACCPPDAFDLAAIVAYGQTDTTCDYDTSYCILGSEGMTYTAPSAGIVVNGQLWCMANAVFYCDVVHG